MAVESELTGLATVAASSEGDMRMTRRFYITLGVLIITLSAIAVVCWWQVQAPVTHIDPRHLSGEATIRRWVLIGPFPFAQADIAPNSPHGRNGGLNHDFLADVGYPEASLTARSFPAICVTRAHCHLVSQQGADLIFDRMFPHTTYAVIYAVAEIVSTADATIGLELGSDDGAKVWLNGHIVLATPNDVDRAAFKYTHLLPVQVHRGRNLLLMKVDQKVDTWALVSSFMSLDAMRSVAIDQADGHILQEHLLTSGDSLHIVCPLFTENAGTLTVKDWRDTAQLATTYSCMHPHDFPLQGLDNGYYGVHLQIGNRVLSDSFYLGSSDTLYHVVADVQKAKTHQSHTVTQLEAILQRYRILTSAQYFHPLDPTWQKKMTMVAKEEFQVLKHPDGAWARLPGMHLRVYKSAVDGTQQDYLLVLPEAPLENLPLVVVMPYAEKPERPFLESSLIAWPDDLEDLRHAADLSHVAVAVINGRGTVGDAPIGEADAFEVLADIVSSYPINKKRLYLYGTCEGGRRALLLAEHYPNTFAAVGTYGPLLLPYNRASQKRHDDVVSLATALSSTPVILVKGEFDDSPPTPAFKAFYSLIASAGSPSEMAIIPDGMHKQKRVENLIFPRLVEHSRPETLSVIDLKDEAIRRVKANNLTSLTPR